MTKIVFLLLKKKKKKNLHPHLSLSLYFYSIIKNMKSIFKYNENKIRECLVCI